MTGIALLYIVIAALVFVAALALIAASRKRRAATCPETGEGVNLTVDRAHAAKAVFTGEHLKVVDCERWPEHADCDRDCAKRLHA